METWVEEGRTTGSREAESQEEELWNWASGWIGDRVARYAVEEAGDNYTVEERERGIENVNTGLRRKLEEDDSSDDDEDGDEDDEMSGTGKSTAVAPNVNTGPARADGKVRSVEDILRLATSGTISNEGLGIRR